MSCNPFRITSAKLRINGETAKQNGKIFSFVAIMWPPALCLWAFARGDGRLVGVFVWKVFCRDILLCMSALSPMKGNHKSMLLISKFRAKVQQKNVTHAYFTKFKVCSMNCNYSAPRQCSLLHEVTLNSVRTRRALHVLTESWKGVVDSSDG